MSDLPGLDVFADLAVTLGRVGDSVSRLAAQQDRARAEIPADANLLATGVYPAAGLLALDLGSPAGGTRWALRRLNVGGSTPTTSVAGRADVFVGTQPLTPVTDGSTPPAFAGTALRPGVLADWVDQATTLPLPAAYSGRQVVVAPGQHLWVVVSSGTAATLYMAAALVEAYQQAAFAERFSL